MEDVSIHINTEDGKKQRVVAPADIKAEELLKLTIEHLELPAGDWALQNKETGRALDPGKTLEENGVRDGQDLFLRVRSNGPICPHCGFENAEGGKYCRSCGKPLSAEPTPGPSPEKDLHFHLHTPDGRTHSVDAPAGMTVKELIAKLVTNDKYGVWSSGPETEWIVDDKDTGTSLVADRSLGENGVANGHHLYLRHQPPVPPFPWKIVVGTGAALLAIVVGYLAYRWVPRKVIITPPSATIQASDTVQFHATLRGQSVAMDWTLNPKIGVISAEGLYQAPPSLPREQTVEIRATRRTQSGTAIITVKPRHTVVGLRMSPSNATLAANETTAFAAAVTGALDTGVHWSLAPQIGNIGSDGSYRAPAVIPTETTVTVTATSDADRQVSDNAVVTLKPVVITLKAPRNEVLAAGSVRVDAVIAGTANHAVRWSISPNLGYISQRGVYFAPPEISEAQNVTIKATSVADPTHFAAVMLRLKAVVAVSLTPAVPEHMEPGQRQKFSASVSGNPNKAVRWSLAGSGEISPDGWYSAPSSISNDQEVRLTATSIADPSKSATAGVLLRAISVSISPANIELFASQSRRFTASVMRSENNKVRWSISPMRGTISTQGEYVAPATIPNEQLVSVMATSLADPTKFATAVVTLRRYAGPLTGVLTWSGRLEKNGMVVIEGKEIVERGGPSLGVVEGDPLPGVPVQISIANSKDFAIEQAPGPSNGWRRISLRSNKSKQAVVKITWMVVQQGVKP